MAFTRSRLRKVEEGLRARESAESWEFLLVPYGAPMPEKVGPDGRKRFIVIDYAHPVMPPDFTAWKGYTPALKAGEAAHLPESGEA